MLGAHREQRSVDRVSRQEHERRHLGVASIRAGEIERRTQVHHQAHTRRHRDGIDEGKAIDTHARRRIEPS